VSGVLWLRTIEQSTFARSRKSASAVSDRRGPKVLLKSDDMAAATAKLGLVECEKRFGKRSRRGESPIQRSSQEAVAAPFPTATLETEMKASKLRAISFQIGVSR
jgi:hypothetical protein